MVHVSPAMSLRLSLLCLLTIVSPLFVAPAHAAKAAKVAPTVIDAGGYTVAFAMEPGWKVQADPVAGSVILQLVERSGEKVRHLAECRILKITVPADQRTMSRDEIAEILSKGPTSFALANLPAAKSLKRPFRQGRNLKTGSRVVAAWDCADVGNIPPRSVYAEAGGTRVWLPDSFKTDGGLYLVLFYEFMTTEGFAPEPEAAKLPSLIAAIQPK